MAWWSGICRASESLMDRNPTCASAIAGIGVSGHMLGCIPVSADGTPLLPCMIHSDSRAADQYMSICQKIGADRLYRISGNILDARSSLSKQLWIRENRPEIYEKTAKFLQCKDFAVARMTGNIDTTDYSDACHGELMDIRNRRYDPAVYQELKLDMAKLPTLHRGCDVVGKVTEESARAMGIPAGIPVIAGGGDGACGSAGAGNVRSGDAYLSLGSTAWIAKVTAEPVIDPQGRLFNIMNLDGETSSVYGAMQSAGSSINWIQRLLRIQDLDTLNHLAAETASGCDGLLYLPYLDGERSPVFDPRASGVFVGMSQRHEQRHFVRAVFEGVAYALEEIASIIRNYGPLQEIRAIGGGMKSPVLPQIIADVCQLRLQTLSVPAADATSLGVAAAAGAAVGVFRDFTEALAHIRVQNAIAPAPPNPNYMRNFQAYLQLYPTLRDTMHLLSQSHNK